MEHSTQITLIPAIKDRRIPLTYLIALTVIFITGLVILYRYDPSANTFYPPCVFKRLTGLNCAGCGSARACYSLLHGRVLQAMNYNILMVLFLPVMAWGFLVQFTGRGLRVWNKISKPLPVLIIICVFWILRNIDAYPLTWLHADK